jgi:hypothetical protein
LHITNTILHERRHDKVEGTWAHVEVRHWAPNIPATFYMLLLHHLAINIS